MNVNEGLTALVLELRAKGRDDEICLQFHRLFLVLHPLPALQLHTHTHISHTLTPSLRSQRE